MQWYVLRVAANKEMQVRNALEQRNTIATIVCVFVETVEEPLVEVHPQCSFSLPIAAATF